MTRIGYVLSTPDGPSTSQFTAAIENDARIAKGQYVEVEVSEGVLLGYVSEVIRGNRYFENPEYVLGLGEQLKEQFPVEEWKSTIAQVKCVGVLCDKMFRRMTWPPKPGSIVRCAQPNTLKCFLGLDDNGLDLGKVQHHDVKAQLNITRLFQKHVAILAMSGAGKSYLTSVIIEELLNRTPDQGTLSIVLLDIHGEYASFTEQYGKKVKRVDVVEDRFQFPLCHAPRYIVDEWANLTPPQSAEFHRVWDDLVKTKGNVSLSEIIEAIEEKTINPNVKTPLLRALREIEAMNIFSKHEFNPNFEMEMEPGKLLIIDLINVDDLKKKQAIASLTGKYLFKKRKNGEIPPFLFIVEEAHNFAREYGTRQDNLSKPIIETMAREGRKFGASLCLISQRPVNLSTTALSQCNTHIIMRISNPNDLDHVQRSAEGIDANTIKMLPSLQVGEAIVVGEAVNAPLFLTVRTTNLRKTKTHPDLETMAKQYYAEMVKRAEQEEKDVEAFL